MNSGSIAASLSAGVTTRMRLTGKSALPRNDVHDVEQVQIHLKRAEWRAAHAFAEAGEPPAQREDIVRHIADAAKRAAVLGVDEVEPVALEQPPHRVDREIVQVRRRMDQAPAGPPETRVQTADIASSEREHAALRHHG